jgi:hypothetical protein
MHRIRQYLHVKSRGIGTLDVSHLHGLAEFLPKHGHTFWQDSAGHRLTQKRLRHLDKLIRSNHPQLRVSLERKYLTSLHLIQGVGAADDGDMPTSVVHNYLKGEDK